MGAHPHPHKGRGPTLSEEPTNTQNAMLRVHKLNASAQNEVSLARRIDIKYAWRRLGASNYVIQTNS